MAEDAWRADEDITEALEARFALPADADIDPAARERLETLSGIHSNAQGLQRWLQTRGGGHTHAH